MPHRLRPLIVLIAVSCASTPHPRLQPPPADILANPRLPDFSFAGYHFGTLPLPHVPVVTEAAKFGVKGDGTTDDTAALRAALDATKGGALVLPAGRFVLRDALRLTRSGVVLRGQGPDKTVLVMPKSLAAIHPSGDPLHGKLYGFIDARGKDEGEVLGQVAQAAQRGERAIRSRSVVDARQGDLIRVRMGNTDALLRNLLGGSLEPGVQTPKDYDHYVDWISPLEAVDGTALTLSRPLPVEVRPEWGAEILSSRPTLEEIGIEDLSFEFPGDAPGEHDDRSASAQSWAEEGFRAIHFRGVVNGWVRNVDIVDADDAIQFEETRSCVVQGVRLLAVHRKTPSGHHGLWAKGAQDCLFSDFLIETQFTYDVTVEAFAQGNVFRRGKGQALNLDHHRNAPHDNLFTDLEAGSGARLWKSGGDANRGPHAGARETLWNVRFRDPPMALPGALHFDKPQDAAWPLLNLLAVSGLAPTDPTKSVWIDPASGMPPDLYEAQRAKRTVSRANTYWNPTTTDRRARPAPATSSAGPMGSDAGAPAPQPEWTPPPPRSTILVFRETLVGMLPARSNRKTWSLIQAGNAVWLRLEEQASIGPINHLDRDSIDPGKWQSTTRTEYAGRASATTPPFRITLHSNFGTPEPEQLVLDCVSKVITVHPAFAKLVEGWKHEDDTMEPASWAPTRTETLPVLNCQPLGAKGAFSDGLSFARGKAATTKDPESSGVEWAFVNSGMVIQEGGYRWIPTYSLRDAP